MCVMQAMPRASSAHNIWQAHDSQLDRALSPFFTFLGILLMVAIVLIQNWLQSCVQLGHALACIQRPFYSLTRYYSVASVVSGCFLKQEDACICFYDRPRLKCCGCAVSLLLVSNSTVPQTCMCDSAFVDCWMTDTSGCPGHTNLLVKFVMPSRVVGSSAGFHSVGQQLSAAYSVTLRMLAKLWLNACKAI